MDLIVDKLLGRVKLGSGLAVNGVYVTSFDGSSAFDI